MYLFVGKGLQQLPLSDLDGGEFLQPYADDNLLHAEVWYYADTMRVGWVDQLGNRLRCLSAFHQGVASTDVGVHLGSNRVKLSQYAVIDPANRPQFTGLFSHNEWPVAPPNNAVNGAAVHADALLQYKATMRNNYGFILIRMPFLSSLDEAVQARL
jgi:hypothetical protein